MVTDLKIYKDLIGLLLGPVRERPALYLGEYKISALPNFITGYSLGRHLNKNTDAKPDKYFDEPGFIQWYFKKYNIADTSFWQTPFLEEAKGDEKIALDLFFKYLDEYSKSNSAET
jgi:hypothetical protein